jgi:hypothetical protein
MADTILIPKDTPDWQNLLSDVQASVSDAENYALATSSFTDRNGNTVQQGAKAWASDAQTSANNAATSESNAQQSALTVQNTVLNEKGDDPLIAFRDSTGHDILRHLKSGDLEIYDPNKRSFDSLSKKQEKNDDKIWGVKSPRGKDFLKQLSKGKIRAFSIFDEEFNHLPVENPKILRQQLFTSKSRQHNFPRFEVLPNGKVCAAFSEMYGHFDPSTLKIIVFSENRAGNLSIDSEFEYGPNTDFFYAASSITVISDETAGKSEVIIPVIIEDRSNGLGPEKETKILVSTDNGKTWNVRSTLPTKNTNFRPNDSRYLRTNKNLYLIEQGDQLGQARFWKSTDKGVSWNELSTFSGLMTEAAFLILTKDTNGNPENIISVTRRSDDNFMNHWYSTDGGNTWTNAGKIEGRSGIASRPKLYKHEGSIVCLYGIRSDKDPAQTNGTGTLFQIMTAPRHKMDTDPSLTTAWGNIKTVEVARHSDGNSSYGDIYRSRVGDRLGFYDSENDGSFESHIYVTNISL